MKKYSLYIILLLEVWLNVLPSYSQSTFVSTWDENWEVAFGMEGLAFYSDDEKGLGLSQNPFRSFRSTFGATTSATKWMSPTWGLRTKASGYWGRNVQGDNKHQNKTKFFAVHEQVMLNLHQWLNGYDPQRRWNAIPYVGLGFARDCYQNENSITSSVGLMNTWRINHLMNGHLDVAYQVGHHFHWAAAEVGLSFKLGNHGFHFFDDSDEQPATWHLKRYALIYSSQRANSIPSGMTLVRRGFLTMGEVQEDSLWNKDFPKRNISVDDFWMDKTEVTNAMYRAFIQDVIDSIIQQRLLTPEYQGDPQKVLASLERSNPVTGEKTIDTSQLNYRYETYDYIEAAQRKYRHPDSSAWISKDTAYIDEKGTIIREVIERPYMGAYDFLNTYIVNIYPDTTCWVNDFPHANNETYMRFYFSKPEYDHYPVVGVTWEQANAYCAWRTEQRKKEMGKEYDEQPFRLPTEAEWEYAARGREHNEYPWARRDNENGGFLANFMPEEGNFIKDGNLITNRVGIYPPNTNGLYDMAGNVAEWTSTAYSEMGVEAMNVINPELTYHATPHDQRIRRRKTVKGGSWKDPANHVQSAWRSQEQQDQPRSYIGFRCARSLTTTTSAKPKVKFHLKKYK